jgi:GNAT superfamily N-acetyltransferase
MTVSKARARTARNVPAWVIETLRSEGPRVLWFSILGETVYRRLLLIEASLTDRPKDSAAAASLEVAWLSPADSRDCALPGLSSDVVAQRLRQGDRCLCARRDGQVVAYRWMAFGAAPLAYLGCTLELAEGVAYVYDAYTVPEARGAGISAALWSMAGSALTAEGCHTTVAVLLPENRPARRAAGKSPYRQVGRVGYVQLGLWRRYFLRCRTRSVALAERD